MQKWMITALLLASTGLASGAKPAAPAKGAANTSAASGTINVNSASAEQIALLPRVGLKLAQKVVEYRKTNGPFKKIEDLMEVKGVGEKLFVVLRPHLTVSGATTLTEKIKSTGMRSRSRAKAAKAA
ncbi:MAG TPA: helix-hairpin-helix domain-containing protein [Thermoanaerobaculia bacterium]|jgi:competence protein ComEA|nr:helix-hairpin-helix domain-containing protein [Thermoanaerobaculia bacterium]